MARGNYERTPIQQARFQKTVTENRIKKLLTQLSEDEVLLNELEETIERLMKEETE